MAIEVKIPSVGESITTGTIATWHQKDGAEVRKGDALLTLETDKVSNDLEAFADGVLKILAEEGAEVTIGAVVATISETTSADSNDSAPAPRPNDAVAASKEETISISPTVRKYADEQKVDLSGVTGTGKKGFITKADIESAIARRRAAEPSQKLTVEPNETAVSAPAFDETRFTRTKMSPLRRKIATHLVNAQQNAAILTTFNECDMSAVLGMRKNLQEAFVAKHGIKLGFMSFFIKAVVEALKTVPSVNGRIEDDHMILNKFYDIGVAVGTERGLIVPVIRDCDQKSFSEIEQAIVDYATKARDGKIELADLQGGCFTISNGGIYGSLLSTPILNPPQSGILGMHTIQQRPIALNGEVVIRPMMYLALSYDHRLVDGKEAVTFLIRIKECLEDPTRLLVEA